MNVDKMRHQLRRGHPDAYYRIPPSSLVDRDWRPTVTPFADRLGRATVGDFTDWRERLGFTSWPDEDIARPSASPSAVLNAPASRWWRR